MSDLALVVYTHTDMEDVWNCFFSQLENFANSYTTYVAVDKHSDLIPKKYNQVYYNDDKQYTKRLSDILDQIKEETILFMHEDMILYDEPKKELITKYANYVNDNYARSIKLICTDIGNKKSDFDKTLIEAIFSIQPTIIKTQALKDLIYQHGSLNIWDFEKSINIIDRDYMVRLGTEKKRGLFHYDSEVFPYIATAITKGKWNYIEYENELDNLFKKYNINPIKRGLL